MKKMLLEWKKKLHEMQEQSAEDLIEKAIEEFGITEDVGEAGYILPGGEFLDLSGKNEGGTPGIRAYDHRQIHSIIDKDFDKHSGGMEYFMKKTGSIRISYSGDYILFDVDKWPTPRQLQSIKDIIIMYEPEEIGISLPNGERKVLRNPSYRDAYKYLAEGDVVSLSGEPILRIYFKDSGNTYSKGEISKIEDDYGNLTFFLKNMIWYQFHDQLEEDFQKMGYSAFDSPALKGIVEKTETEEYEKMQDLLIRSMDKLQKNLKPEDFQRIDEMIKNYAVLLVNIAHEYKDSDPEIFDRKLRTIMSEVYDKIIALVNIQKL